MTSPDDAPRSDAAPVSVEAHWRELVTAALLGTDRRDPPAPIPELVDLVDDTARAAPSERMLAHVAACTAVRRAGVVPGPPVDPLAPPDPDEREPCPPAAVDRWHHVTTSWPVLDDEWMLTLIGNGWRLAPELVPAALGRHRRDPVRHARVRAAGGPLADWLIGHLPDLASTKPNAVVDAEALAELPELPIPPDLADLATAPGADIGRVIGTALEAGELGQPHRAVLVNLVARIPAGSLADLGAALDSVDPSASGAGLASVLADLATTRRRMLEELGRV